MSSAENLKAPDLDISCLWRHWVLSEVFQACPSLISYLSHCCYKTNERSCLRNKFILVHTCRVQFYMVGMAWWREFEIPLYPQSGNSDKHTASMLDVAGLLFLLPLPLSSFSLGPLHMGWYKPHSNQAFLHSGNECPHLPAEVCLLCGSNPGKLTIRSSHHTS